MEKTTKYTIAVDPGFNGFKVVINGMYFFIPRAVIRKMGQSNYALGNVDGVRGVPTENKSNYIVYKSDMGDEYYVGAEALELAASVTDEGLSKFTMGESFINQEFFKSEEFSIILDSTIGYAIYRYNKEVLKPATLDNKDFNLGEEIEVILTLPHSYCDTYAPTIADSQKKEHKYSLTIGENREKFNFNYTLTKDNLKFMSQIIASVLCKLLETGDKEADYSKVLPTLIIDGGYYTTGLLTLDAALRTNTTKNVSNLEFTMNTINNSVCAQVAAKTTKTNLNSYLIDKYILSDKEIKYRNSDNVTLYFDLEKEKSNVVKDITEKFIHYLDKEYDNFNDYKTIHIAGGTGILFANAIKEYFVTKTKTFKEEQVILIQGKNYTKNKDPHIIDSRNHCISVGYTSDEDFSASFGIVVGAYRALKSQQ